MCAQKKKPVKAQKPPTKKAARVKPAFRAAENLFPIAAIGGSAGGIEAISRFLAHLQPDLGIAYVIIQHLSPDHSSILPSLLERRTAMKVHLVKDGMKIQPDNVYVIPPAVYMTITDGHLVLVKKHRGDKQRHVFDHFLQSLAPVYQHKAIAIVLSGVGFDGTQGVQLIKAEGGISFAQDDSALFQSMARNAYESGYIDFILSPEGIADELAVLSRQHFTIESHEKNAEVNERALKRIHLLLHNRFGVDFAQYKGTTINRRILRRMALNRLDELEQYIKLLRENQSELELLYRDLLINVTSFFREPNLFTTLAKTVFPTLVKNRKAGEPLRIWIPACSSGEEACSMAISLFEYLGEKAYTTAIQIFATDLSETAIEKARTGIYSRNSLQHVSPQRLSQFFVKIDGSYQIIKPIRDICIFATHNLLKDPPFSRMDLISCQNVMIYLASSAQKKILQAFHYALKPGGYLALGKSETIGNDTDLFELVDKEQKLYIKKAISQPLPFDFFNRPAHVPLMQQSFNDKTGVQPASDIDIEKETDKLLLARYVPASLVVNKDLQILRFHGAINEYLQPAAGKASLHLLKMVKDELVFELRGLLSQAKKSKQAISKEGLHLKDSNFHRLVKIEVTPIKSQVLSDPYFLIVFSDDVGSKLQKSKPAPPKKGRPDSKDRRIDMLEQELKDAREQMKTMNEEFESIREELQSANEEVLSSNEELQSINEELETSKEEMQSTNEELITINEELQLRNADLKESVEYTEAIVQTIRDPLVVLHTDLRVRTANKAFYTLFNLKQDIDGYYFFELAGGLLDVPALRQQLKETVMKGIGFQDFELTYNFRELGEKTLLFNAMRMHGEGDKRARILLAIGNVTERKRAEESLRRSVEQFKESEERLRVAMEAGKMGTWDWNIFKDEILWSTDHNIMFGIPVDQRSGSYAAFLEHVHPSDREHVREVLKKAIDTRRDFAMEMRSLHTNGRITWIAAFGRAFYNGQGKAHRMIGVVIDITERKRLESQKEEFLGIASHELRTPVTSIKAYTQLLQEMLVEKNEAESIEIIDKLDRQVDRLTHLIADLLDITRISEGQLTLQPEVFSINDQIIEIVELMQRTTAQHVIVNELQQLPAVKADRERIGQVLINLISNAIKYSPNSHRIIVSTALQNNQVKVSIQDFGIGMSEATRLRIFDRFFRASDNNIKTFPGLGLGLFIASDIIKKHGGEIGVESEREKGTLIYFTLPVFEK
ncbi:CheR family methyltransferase [Niastella sp. OAS944]|uniref:CheR family methyltransferase n=1 Tax=Niastella sp. OAS944 TaxID=2664089 RepID=UPI003494AD6C|nr:two-component system CheB/CheR fusion protein [Chitinophagaceae bacterium OAS944]